MVLWVFVVSLVVVFCLFVFVSFLFCWVFCLFVAGGFGVFLCGFFFGEGVFECCFISVQFFGGYLDFLIIGY